MDPPLKSADDEKKKGQEVTKGSWARRSSLSRLCDPGSADDVPVISNQLSEVEGV